MTFFRGGSSFIEQSGYNRAIKIWETQRDFESGGYILRKEVMDGTCFSLFYFTIHFDSAYRITKREIEGGEFITREEYQRLAHPTGVSSQ
jgi:hypothetical protein